MGCKFFFCFPWMLCPLTSMPICVFFFFTEKQKLLRVFAIQGYAYYCSYNPPQRELTHERKKWTRKENNNTPPSPPSPPPAKKKKKKGKRKEGGGKEKKKKRAVRRGRMGVIVALKLTPDLSSFRGFFFFLLNVPKAFALLRREGGRDRWL